MPRHASALVHRVSGRGAHAWRIHEQAIAAERRGEDTVILSVGDPDCRSPEVVGAAAKAAIDAGDTHYTPSGGRPQLRAEIARRHEARTGEMVAERNVMITSGAQNALFFAAACLLDPGDRVAVIEPAYVTYPATIEWTGAVIDYVVSPPERGFAFDAAALEAAIRPETRAIVFANPNNPTGGVLTRAELEAIAEIAVRHDLWIVVDEVYADLVFEGTFVPMASVPAARGRTVTVSSLSKSHAMTGWRMGWMIAPAALIKDALLVAQAMLYGLPGFIQEGALAALTSAADAPAEMTALYRRRRDIMVGELGRVRGLAVLSPQAGMFAMIDVSGTGLDGAGFAEALWAEEKVSVLDGSAFSPTARDFVRLSFATADERIAEGARRIRRFVERRLAAAA